MMKVTYTTVCLLLLVIFGACNGDQTKNQTPNVNKLFPSLKKLEPSFQSIINIKNINKYVKMTLDEPAIDEIQISSRINIAIENISKKKVYFPVDLGVRLFTIRENNWVEVENSITYSGNPAILLPNGPADINSFTSLNVNPEINNEGQKEFLRIVIIGEELNNDGERTGIPVAATLDLILNP